MLLGEFWCKALLIVFLSFSMNIARGAQAPSNSNETLAIRSSLTWRTLSGPEINFLLVNRGDEEASFFFDEGAMLHMKQTCVSRLRELDGSIFDGVGLLGDRLTSLTPGKVTPRGWIYRTYYINGGMQHVPCEKGFKVVGYIKDTRIDLFNSVVQFPSKMPSFKPNSSQHELRVSSSVEPDFHERRRHNNVLVNILIENNAANDELVWVSDRSLRCTGNAKVSWNTEWPVPEGEDNGPRHIGGKSWSVLVAPVRLVAGASFDKCVATFQISRRTLRRDVYDLQWTPVRTIDVALKPVK